MADAVGRSLAHLARGSNNPRSCCVQSQSFCKGLRMILIAASFFRLTFSSQSCSFNRTYSIPSALDFREFTSSRLNPVEIYFDVDEFSLPGDPGIVSPFIQESAIASTTLIISIPVSIATETFDVFVNCSRRDPSSEILGSADYITGHFSCVEMCNRTFDLTSLNHVSPSELGCTISTNQTAEVFDVTENSKVLVSLKLVIQDLVQEAEQCLPGQFQCNDGRCFDVTRLCDAVPDCVHGDDEVVCDEYPLGSICNFEKGLCGWRPSKQFWIRHKGPTRTGSTGPDIDHTLGTSNGYYVYTEASDMVQMRDNTAILRSPLFQPASSSEDGSIDCKVTFYYHFHGDRIESLSLYAMEEDSNESSRLYNLRKRRDVDWERVTVSIEKVFTKRYFLQFEGSIKPFGSRRGDIAIDDISMSSGCFNIDIDNRIIDTFHQCRVRTLTSTMVPSDITSIVADLSDTTRYDEKEERYEIEVSKKLTSTSSPDADRMQTKRKNVTRFLFTNCGQIGPTGPTQQQCDLYYMHSNVTVRVYNGLQEWLVPQSGLYRITAIGAIGGSGVENPGPSGGASVEAIVNLSVGSKLIILVGQAGHSACSEMSFPLPGVKDICDGKLSDMERKRLGSITAGGGGGGGGGSFVALLQSGRHLSDPVSWEQILVPLVVAGGGGGLAFSPSADAHVTSHGIFSATNSGASISGGQQGGRAVNNLPGAGGGWYDNDESNTNGKSLVSGGGGGNGCQRAKYEYEWEVPGGFGGGGGGCTAGGGGGGYIGGYASLVDNITGDGKGGSSFVTNLSFSPPKGESGVNLAGHGKVLIELVIMCPDKKFVPIYVGANGCNDHLIPLWCWIVIVVSLVALVALLVLVLWCRVGSRRTEEDRLRDELALLRKNVMSEINPLYGARKSIKEEDFPELPRASLKLLHPLGNGAFGEVYKGAYFPSKEKNESICVAIKTLSKDATDEHKNDFLMEAVLLGSLKHYNIVKLVGVSFIRVPKFLVLEFMEGGDLKTFLQANRPTFEHKTSLKMTDLLRLSMDVAEGCKYLESLRFIHRDLAARNILLTTRGPGRVAKIGDFGMAKDVYKSEYYRKSKNSLVPVKWMPPEAYLDGIFSTKTDVWSFGVLLWEILTFAYIPYPGLSNHEVIQCVAKGDRMCPPRYCPKALKALMESCWRTNPDQRPTFEYLCVLLVRLSDSRDVTSASIPSHGIEVDRCLVSAYSYESDPDTSETNPMLPSAIYPPANHFSTDSEGYLQAAFSDKKDRKTTVRLDSLEDDFPKSVQMNIYDSEGPTSASIIEDEVNANSCDLNHEYSFPPMCATAPKATVERSESLV